MTNSTSSDLEVLLPGRDVQCKGETIRVLPLFFGQIPKAVKLIRPLATVLQKSRIFNVGQVDGKVKFEISASWATALPEIIELGGEALMEFFAFSIGKSRAWFDTLPSNEGLKLAEAVFKENVDFFAQKILPMLQVVLQTEDPSTTEDGATSSLGSFDTGTLGNQSNA